LFLAEIAKHLAANPRQIFADDSFITSAPPPKVVVGDSMRESLSRIRAGETVAEIAARRQMTPGTVHGHLAACIEAGEAVPLPALLEEADWECISEALRENGFTSLSRVHSALDGRYDHGVLRIVRAAMQQGRKFR